MIQNCNDCVKERSNKAEPLIPSVLPDRPSQKIRTDLFELKGKPYLLCIDCFSRSAEVALLSKSTTAPDVITYLKPWFARHGIPDNVVSDNGPQFQASEFAKFANDYGFKHQPSSPKYLQSNGEVERAVKTVKSLLRKSTDPYLALMAYGSTPLENCYSPSELLFGRKNGQQFQSYHLICYLVGIKCLNSARKIMISRKSKSTTSTNITESSSYLNYHKVKLCGFLIVKRMVKSLTST